MVTRRFFECTIGTVLILALVVIAPGTGSLGAKQAFADDALDARQLVDRARLTFETFLVARETEGFRGLVKDAKGVFIAPQILRGALIVGASGGSGVFLVKGKKPGEWTGPAFYTIGEASFGLQIGGDASEVVLLVMTERGVNALLKSSVKLGGDIGIAVGPVGVGVNASTANLSADIVTFSRSKGLYGGISLEGAIVKTRDGLNQAYYGANKVSPKDILIGRKEKNAYSASLIEIVAKGTEGR